MSRRAATLAIVALALVAPTLASCARRKADSADVSVAAQPVPLTVENRHRFDVNVYVARDGGGQSLRLGTVVAATSKALVVPASYTGGGAFRLIADPIGPSAGSTFTSERVIVTGVGRRVVWTLESSLARSTVSVY